MLGTFEPFRQGDRMFALVSPHYTATSVLDLHTGDRFRASTSIDGRYTTDTKVNSVHLSGDRTKALFFSGAPGTIMASPGSATGFVRDVVGRDQVPPVVSCGSALS